MTQIIAYLEEIPFEHFHYKFVKLYDTNTHSETILSFNEFIHKFPPVSFSMVGTPLGHLGYYKTLKYTTNKNIYDELIKNNSLS